MAKAPDLAELIDEMVKANALSTHTMLPAKVC